MAKREKTKGRSGTTKGALQRMPRSETIPGIPTPKGPPVAKSLALQWLRATREDFGESERNVGRSSHTQGTYLLQLHAHRTWLLFPDCKGFFDMVKKHTGIGRSWATDLMRFARVATADQAETYGRQKTMAGHALVKILGLGAFRDLLDKELLEEKLGQPFDFAKATAGDLEEILAGLIESPPALPPSRSARLEASQQQRVIDARVERRPVLRPLKVRAYVRDNVVRVRNEPCSSREELAALAELYRELSKE